MESLLPDGLPEDKSGYSYRGPSPVPFLTDAALVGNGILRPFEHSSVAVQVDRLVPVSMREPELFLDFQPFSIVNLNGHRLLIGVLQNSRMNFVHSVALGFSLDYINPYPLVVTNSPAVPPECQRERIIFDCV